jgi:transcription elongation factor GreA
VAGDTSDALTQAQKEKLEAELAELEGPRRAEAVQAIATARSFGDLSENFEYHAAKNEQGLLERKITILRARLEDAVIVEGGDPDLVGVGSRVVIEDGDGGRLEVEISGLGGNGTSSPSSPLGAALLGRRVGETVEVNAPRGTWQAKIVEIRAA